MSKFLVAIVIIIFFASCDCNQEVRGTIVDKQNDSTISNIVVYKKNKSWIRTMTDSAGRFELSDISGGYGCPPMIIVIHDKKYKKVEVSIDAGLQKVIRLEKNIEY